MSKSPCMSRTPDGCVSTVGFSQWGKSAIAQRLHTAGIKKNWQEKMYSALAGRLGLGGQAFVHHPDYDKQWDLCYNRNLVHAAAALAIWCLFIWFVFFQLFHATCDLHNLTTCITTQRMQTLPWDETVDPVGEQTEAIVYLRSMNKHLSLDITACLIANGNYLGYKKNSRNNIIDPVEGGCAPPTRVNLSSEQSLNTLVGDGGCKLFKTDNAYRFGWCHKVSSPVIGQFGDPAYRFVKINVVANVQEMIAAGNYTNLDFIYPEFVGGKKHDWNSVYYTFDPFYPLKKEMFFQRSEIVKHSSLEFFSSNVPKAEKTYLQYHHEYNRWQRSSTDASGQRGSSALSRPDLLANKHLVVASIYLRATSSRVVYDERQVKTLYDFPKDAGGFWTASLFLGACGYMLLKLVFPRKVPDLSDLLRREQQKQLRQWAIDGSKVEHDVAHGQQTFVSSQPPSDFARSRPTFEEQIGQFRSRRRARTLQDAQSIELGDVECQVLEGPASPPLQPNGGEGNGDGLGTVHYDELPKHLVL